MRKESLILVSVLGCVLITAVAWAQDYGMAGCGFGSAVFKEKNDKTSQVLAATTNATLGSQTFGITSGTLNCTTDGMVKKSRAQQAFAEVNFEDLSEEMAKGQGEHLQAFAYLFGCSETSVSAFGRMAQQHYAQIFSSNAITPADLIHAVKQHIANDPVLSHSCQA